MERKLLIRRFLTSGYQLTSDALDFLIKSPEKAEEFLKKPRPQTPPSIITLDFLKSFLREECKIEKIVVDNYTKVFGRRFETLKNMFSKRLDLVNLISINKISPRTKKFSLIGMVKEKNEPANTITLEDWTGEVEIVLDRKFLKEIVLDEVLGVVCEKTGENISGLNIVSPDVPMRRETCKTKKDMYCFFISDLHIDSGLFNKKYYTSFINWLEEQKEEMNIFVVGDVSSNIEDVEKLLSDIPKIHKVHLVKGETDPGIEKFLSSPFLFQVEDVKLFLFHNKKLDDYVNLWGTPDNAISNLVKKRHLDPIFTTESKIYEKDPYLLDRIPDIIVAGHTHIPSSTNYKGVTILATGSFISQPIFWLTNLRTREIFKVDFS